MKSMRMFAVPVLAMTLALFGAACEEREGPAERAGEAMDNAADEAGEALEDAGDKMEDAAH